MKIKTSLLFFITFQFSVFSLFSNIKPPADDFLVTVSSRLLINNSCKAILVSNQKGEWLHYAITSEEEEEEDLVIQFKKNQADQVFVSLFFKYKALTYVNIENGTYIDKVKSPYYINRGHTKQIQIKIDGVNNVEDFKYFSNRKRQKNINLESPGGAFTHKYYTSDNLATYCLIHSNGEKRYRYFYDENKEENNRRRTRVNRTYHSLGVLTKKRRINLPSSARWFGKIKTQMKKTEKPFYIYNERNSKDLDEASYLELPYPTGQFDFTHLELESYDFIINKYFKGVPTNILDPKIELEVITHDQLKLEFKASKNVGFYIATYLFPSEDYINDLNLLRNWKFIGIDKNVAFDLPVIPDDIVKKIPNLLFNEPPRSLTVVAYQIEYEDPYDSWIVPHTLLEKEWQTEGGVIGLKKRMKIE